MKTFRPSKNCDAFIVLRSSPSEIGQKTPITLPDVMAHPARHHDEARNSNPGGARFVGGALGSDPDYVVHHRGATHCRRRLPVSTASYAPRARRRTSLRLPAGRPRRAPHSGGRTEAPSTSLPQNAGGRHVRIAASPCAWLPPWLDEWFQHETEFDPSVSENPGCTLPA